MTKSVKALPPPPPEIFRLSRLEKGSSIFFEDPDGFMSFFFKVEAIDERSLPVVSIEVDGLNPERQECAETLGRGVMLGTCSFDQLLSTATNPDAANHDAHIDTPLSHVVRPALGNGDTLLIEGIRDGQLITATYPIPTIIREIEISNHS